MADGHLPVIDLGEMEVLLNINVCMRVFAATTDGPALGCALASSFPSCPFAF